MEVKPLAFPSASWTDLFTLDLSKKDKVLLRTGDEWTWVDSHRWRSHDLALSSLVLAPVGKQIVAHAPTKMLLDFVLHGANNVPPIIVRDLLYPRITVRDNGTSLVTLSHNAILGSRWLAEVPTSSIPLQP